MAFVSTELSTNMKSELPTGKPNVQTQPRRKSSSLVPLVGLTILLVIPLYYVSIRDYSESIQGPIKTAALGDEENVDRTCPVGSGQCKDEDSDSDSDSDDDDDDDRVRDSTMATSEEGKRKEPEKVGFGSSSEQGIRKEPEKPQVDSPKDATKKPERDAEIQRSYDDSTNNPNEFINQETSEKKEQGKHREGSPVQENLRKPVTTFRGNTNRLIVRSRLLEDNKCDIFTGEWVPNPEGPYYTNQTCNAIQEHQNCMKFGRPDMEFLKWRWKPDDCELPVFDPERFLELVKGKSIAFVGDSVARNHMQSLICLLSRVASPEDLSDPLDQNRRYEYRQHDFNISMLWSPYLVRTELTVPNDENRPFRLYLDEYDESWTTKIAHFDYVIINAGHWFFRPTYFYVNKHLVGCLYCQDRKVRHLKAAFSYRRAFRTALRAVNEAAGYTGVTFLRTFAPSHFEGAPWDKGGDCVRTRPYKRGETAMEDYSQEMYLVQLEELRIAQKVGRRKRKFVLFDATEAMQLRPDGHPSKYGRWPMANQTVPNDCVHWCLPGPIDAWGDFLQELLRRETQGSRRRRGKDR